MKKKTLMAVLTIMCVAVFSLVGCGGSSGGSGSSVPSKPTLGSTVEFDNLIIKFGDSYEFTTITNQFSDKSGADIIALPVTITNNSKETHGLNMFYVDAYGTAGKKLDTVFTYFDDGMETFDQMRSGASIDGHLYLLYDGDGEYVIELKKVSGKATEITIPVTK